MIRAACHSGGGVTFALARCAAGVCSLIMMSACSNERAPDVKAGTQALTTKACVPTECDDANPSTIDSCSPEGCLHRYAAPTNLSFEKITPFAPGADAEHSVIGGVNNAGVVVAMASIHTRSDIPEYYENRAFRFTPPSSYQILEPGPFVTNPVLTDGTRTFNSGIPAFAGGINDKGQTAISVQVTFDGWYAIARDGAGTSWRDQVYGMGHAAGINASGDLAATTLSPNPPYNNYQAARWTPSGGVVLLGGLGATARAYSISMGIADDGTVVGNAWLPATTNETPWYQAGHAFVALPGAQMVDLNSRVDPTAGWELIQANGISPSARFIVGLGLRKNAPPGQDIRAYRYDTTTGIVKDLGETPATGLSWAHAVNNFGDVAGLRSSGAFVFTDDYGMLDVQSLLPANSGWRVHEAKAINDSRVVLAHATRNNNGKQQILKIQIPKPACNGGGGFAPSLIANGSFECDLSGWT